MTKISIVIPVYNGEKYLKECIESCINQDHDDYEIIVINDGSTDKSLEIAKSYSNLRKPYVKVFSKENGGTASALNLGIKKMTGEWFKWLSADDTLLPHALTTLARHAYDEYTLYYADYNIIDKDSKITSVYLDKQYEHQAAQMYYNFYGNGTTSLISKHAFNTVGLFAEDLPYSDDYEFWMRWTLKYRYNMKHIPQVIANYRMHSESLTGGRNVDEALKLVDSLRAMYEPYLTSDDRKHLKNPVKIPFKRRLGRRFPILRRLKNF